jgi:ubiquinone/menaquinone biosynthesis C-methylase UbiE
MGRAAPFYGFGGSGFLTSVAERLVRLVGVRPAASVLDVATGPAVGLTAVHELFPDASLHGIDLSEGMVAEANRRLLERGVKAAVELMDAEALTFPDEAFDLVLCASALQQFPHPDAALVEFRRVLGRGGRVGISIFGDHDARWEGKDRLVAELAPRMGQVGQTFDESKLRAALARAGFQEPHVVRERLDVQYADAAAWLDASWGHGERRALDAMDEGSLSQFRSRLPDALEAAREEDGKLHWRPEVIYAISTD